MTSPDNGKKPKVGAARPTNPAERTAAPGNVLTTLPVAMTGRASPATSTNAESRRG